MAKEKTESEVKKPRFHIRCKNYKCCHVWDAEALEPCPLCGHRELFADDHDKIMSRDFNV